MIKWTVHPFSGKSAIVRIVLLFAVTAAAMSLIFAVVYGNAIKNKTNIFEYSKISSQIQAQLIAEKISSTLNEVDISLSFIASIAESAGNLSVDVVRSLSKTINQKLKFKHSIANILLIDAEGSILFALDEKRGIHANPQEQGYFKRHRDRWETFAYERIGGREYEHDWFLISRRIDDGANGFLGVVVGIIDPSAFYDLNEDFVKFDIDVFSLYDHEGDVISFVSPSDAFAGSDWEIDIKHHPFFSSFSEERLLKGGLFALENDSYILAHNLVNDYPFHIVIGLSKERILSIWKQDTTKTLIISLFSAGIIIPMSFILIHQMMKRKKAEADMRKTIQESQLHMLLHRITLFSAESILITDMIKTSCMLILENIRWTGMVLHIYRNEEFGTDEDYVDTSGTSLLKPALDIVQPDSGVSDSINWYHDIAAMPGRQEREFHHLTGARTCCALMVYGKEQPLAHCIFFNSRTENQSEYYKNLMFQSLTLIKRLALEKKSDRKMKESLAEKEVLLKEVHHREKNNLQIISSLLNLQKENMVHEDDMRVFKSSQNRIKAMAIVHELLYQSEDFSTIDLKVYIDKLLAGLAFDDPGAHIRFVKDIEGGIALSIDTAIPCGLLINELITNSIKHAFPDSRKGSIMIGVRREQDGSLLLTVKDDGVGFTHDAAIKGKLGMLLIESLINQLRGRVERLDGIGVDDDCIA